jgi:RNA polymerase sigma-70 factor (ECF subfamily)
LATQGAAGANCLLPASLASARSSSAQKIEEQIVECFSQLRLPIYRYLIGIHVAPEEAEELIQESFLRLYEQLSRGGRIENIRGWAFRVAHNLAVNELKGRRHVASISPEQWESMMQTRQDPRPGPEEQLLDKERMAHIHDALCKLSPLQRQCVHLRVEGFRYREIADILDLSVPTIAESLRRAVVKLATDRHG